MRIFVKTEVFETITRDEEVARLREAVGRQMQRILKSGKLESGWVSAVSRSPMFIFKVDAPTEVMDLLGCAFIDHFRIEAHPIISLEELGRFFETNPPGK